MALSTGPCTIPRRTQGTDPGVPRRVRAPTQPPPHRTHRRRTAVGQSALSARASQRTAPVRYPRAVRCAHRPLSASPFALRALCEGHRPMGEGLWRRHKPGVGLTLASLGDAPRPVRDRTIGRLGPRWPTLSSRHVVTPVPGHGGRTRQPRRAPHLRTRLSAHGCPQRILAHRIASAAGSHPPRRLLRLSARRTPPDRRTAMATGAG